MVILRCQSFTSLEGDSNLVGGLAMEYLVSDTIGFNSDKPISIVSDYIGNSLEELIINTFEFGVLGIRTSRNVNILKFGWYVTYRGICKM